MFYLIFSTLLFLWPSFTLKLFPSLFFWFILFSLFILEFDVYASLFHILLSYKKHLPPGTWALHWYTGIWRGRRKTFGKSHDGIDHRTKHLVSSRLFSRRSCLGAKLRHKRVIEDLRKNLKDESKSRRNITLY